MGFLAQGAAQAFGFGNAAQAAKSSLAWDTAGIGLTAGGQFLDGVGGMQQGLYQSQVAKNNAAIAASNAESASDAGDFGAQTSLIQGGKLAASQKAAYAANGIDVGSGSAAETMDATARISALDAAMIHFNAARQAFGDMSQAENFRAEASLTKRAGYGMYGSGVAKSASTLLAGASAVGKKYASFKTVGAVNGSGS